MLRLMVDADSSGLHLWLVLWKAYSAVQEYALADVERLGFGLSDFGILEVLIHKGPLPVNEIGARMRLTSGSMTAAVDRLERRGLVERRDDPADRRTRVVHLTSEGLRTIESGFGEHSEAMNALGELLSEEERAEAIRLLKKLGRAAAARPGGLWNKPT
ncbi:MAG: MarR family transcriptional regulator [Bryobacteraceae bacterium]|nr:MarR family transcriptional regulator [Bryobacteraceae bacterium]